LKRTFYRLQSVRGSNRVSLQYGNMIFELAWVCIGTSHIELPASKPSAYFNSAAFCPFHPCFKARGGYLPKSRYCEL